MHVLIIKTSSLGDIIHTLPALTDARRQRPDIVFDWVIEPAFAEIPLFHPAVNKIIPVSLRQWRKNIFQTLKNHAWQPFYHALKKEKYDLVIDAQGLIKSGMLTFFARGIKCGYDKYSAWEPLACLAYDRKYPVKREQHAITRIRQLFARCLDYPIPEATPDYGIELSRITLSAAPARFEGQYAVFLHGTTRADKYWPEEHWQKLMTLCQLKNLDILLPWGNEEEKQRAERLASQQPHTTVLPKLSLTELAFLLSRAKINIGVDSGLGHLAAALNAPAVTLYGPTDPALIGTIGNNQIHLKANSMKNIEPEKVNDYIML
jgi:heptosyltransferase-1